MAEKVVADELDSYRSEMKDRIKRHLGETNYRLNPNGKAVDALVDGLAKRKARFGDYYCPCRVVTGNAEKDALNVCPCSTHEEEIAASGKCHCGLFFAAEK